MWPCHSPLVLLCQLALYLSLLSVWGCVFTLASLLLDQHTWKQSGDNSPVCKPVITHLLLTAEDSFQLMPDCCISSGSVAQACFGTAWFSLRADASCLLSFCSAKFVEKKEPEKKTSYLEVIYLLPLFTPHERKTKHFSVSALLTVLTCIFTINLLQFYSGDLHLSTDLVCFLTGTETLDFCFHTLDYTKQLNWGLCWVY